MWDLKITLVLIGVTSPSCRESRLFLTLVSHLFVVVAQMPLQNLLFQSPLSYYKNLHFLYVYNCLSTFHCLCSLCPFICVKARPAGFGCFPPSPKRPVFTLCSSSCPLVSLPGESKGCSGWKGRTPVGHRHVRHVLCDGVWLRALWTSHSCQS